MTSDPDMFKMLQTCSKLSFKFDPQVKTHLFGGGKLHALMEFTFRWGDRQLLNRCIDKRKR